MADGPTENLLKQTIKGLDRPAPGGATPKIKTETPSTKKIKVEPSTPSTSGVKMRTLNQERIQI